MLRGFTRVTLVIMGSLLAWLACFTAIYVLGALACARGLAATRIAGFGVIGLMTTVLVLATAAFTLWQIAAAARHRRSAAHNDRFSGFLARSLGGLVMLGVVLLSLPATIVRPACAGQPMLDTGAGAASASLPEQSYSPAP